MKRQPASLNRRRTLSPCGPLSLLLLSLLLPLILGMACDGGKEKKAAAKIDEIVKEYKRGPVAFTLKINPKEVTIADHLRLTMEVTAKEEYKVELPEFGEKLEQFGIVDYDAPAPRLIEDSMVLYRKSYELEPFLSGEYKIPPMTVVFFKEGEGEGEQKRHEIESEELTVTVKSLLPEKAAELTIKEIVPPVELPRSPRIWLYTGIAAGTACACSALGFLLWRRRRARGVGIPARPPHEVAYEALEALLSKKLIEKGEVKVFYLQLSNILRHYIEGRFALRAPERTTEEFLSDLRATDVLVPAHKGLLKEFLTHCDMVKFAEHQPSNEEIQKAFDACKRFIVETEQRPKERADLAEAS